MSTVDDFNLGQNSKAAGLASFGSSTLYAVGSGTTGGQGYWLVRRSSDSGASWSTVDNYSDGTINDTAAVAVAVDASGQVYVAGTSGSGVNWLVRKSADGGNSWATIDNFTYGYDVQLASLAVGASGNVVVVGSGYDTSYLSHWLVRGSTDGGTTWSTVDDYNYSTGITSSASAVSIDTSGKVFVAGNGVDPSSHAHWIVRESTDSGATWSVKDNFLDAGANAITLDGLGNLFVTGQWPGSNNAFEGVTRKSADGGSTWVTIDTFLDSVNGSNGQGLSLVACGTSQLCVVGQSSNIWLTRILSP